VFLAFCIDAQMPGKTATRVGMVKTINRINGVAGAALSIIAWPTVAISFTPAGVAFPSLLFAYALSGLSLVGVVASPHLHARRTQAEKTLIAEYDTLGIEESSAAQTSLRGVSGNGAIESYLSWASSALVRLTKLARRSSSDSKIWPKDLFDVPEELWHDKEVVMRAIQKHGSALVYTTEELQRDREVVLAAIRKGPYALSAVAEELKRDTEVVLAAIQLDGSALTFAADELKRDKEVVMAAVRQNGWALEFAAEERKRDKEVVMAAIQQNATALQFAAEELKRDKEFVMAAIQQNANALRFAAEELKRDKEVVMAAVQQIKVILEVRGYDDVLAELDRLERTSADETSPE